MSPREQVPGVEGGPAAVGDALSRGGTGQDDDLGWSGGGRHRQRGQGDYYKGRHCREGATNNSGHLHLPLA